MTFLKYLQKKAPSQFQSVTPARIKRYISSMGRRKKTETYEPHNLLDEDCRHYIESAIANYHNICKDLFNHIEFLEYWFDHIEKSPTPQNAALCAFGFFKQNSLAENYLTNLRKHYNRLCDSFKPKGVSRAEWEKSDTIKKYNRGKEIAQWIKSYQSREPYNHIITDDIEWTPITELTQREKNIALELSFGWSIARLWQLLKSRDKEYFVEIFLGIKVQKELEHGSIENKTCEIVPADLIDSLTNINPEKEPFFDRYLHFFSPEYLNDGQLCNFWKKACISSINGLAISNARRQPLDKIWLLARFFNVHFYSLDFIKASRGIPERAAKQFETLANPSLLNKIVKEKISTLSKKEYRKWGRKGLRRDEFFLTLASRRDFSILKQMGDKNFPEFQNDNSAALYEKSVSNVTESHILNRLSILTNKGDSKRKKEAIQKLVVMAQNDKSNFFSAYIVLSLFDYFYANFNPIDEDDSDDTQKDESIEDEDKEENSDAEDYGLGLLFLSAVFSWSLEHEKNLFLISNSDFDESFWDGFFKITPIILQLACFCKQKNLPKSA